MLALAPGAADAAPLRLVRDAEIEHAIRLYSTAVFEAAGLDPLAVNVYLVQDKRINAFVAGGMNLFINTGLIMKAENAGELIGVIAHETGHIAGGHLARTSEALRGARGLALLSLILGAAVIAAGGGEAGVGAIVGGTGVAERTLLSYSRAQENAADQAGMRYLDVAGQSAEGMLSFIGKLADQELLSPTQQDPYLRTHPLTRDRIAAVRRHVETSAQTGKPLPESYEILFDRVRAKLTGFLEPPATTRRRYPASDASLPARYARALALYREADVAGAVAAIDALLDEAPDDPFFLELKGQVYFENGDAALAVPEYRRSVALLPDEPLLRLGLAQALLDTGDTAVVDEAIATLEAIVRRDRDYPATWQLLGQAYGRAGRDAESALAAAESAFLFDRRADARHFAERALKGLEPGSPNWLHAQDILAATESEP